MTKPFVANAEELNATGDEALITALAFGATVEAAAAKANISRATAYRRLGTPEVRQRVKELKAEMVNRTAAMLSAAGSEAVRTLLLLLGGGYSSSSRLGAARAILEMGCRVREMAEWEERLATLEQRFLDGDHVLTETRRIGEMPRDFDQKVSFTDRKPRKRCLQPSFRARVRFLEEQLRHKVSAPGDDEEISDEEFLANFRTAQEQGLFRHEPDFSEALAAYEAAIEAARNDPAAGYLPPPEFMPHSPELHRRRAWRVGRPNRSVMKASVWILAINQRVLAGESPLGLQEWEQLKEWLRGRRRLLALLEKKRRKRERASSDIYKGDAQDVMGLWRQVKQDDGKQFDSHELARDLRLLYARYEQRLRNRTLKQRNKGVQEKAEKARNKG